MAEIVSLKRARKARARAAAEAKADANRIAHGTPKAERDRTRSLRKKEADRHAGHRLDDENG